MTRCLAAASLTLVVAAASSLEWESKVYSCIQQPEPHNSSVCVPIPFDAPAEQKKNGTSLLICQANCGVDGNIWPKPNSIKTNQNFHEISRCTISFALDEGNSSTTVRKMLYQASEMFFDIVDTEIDPLSNASRKCNSSGVNPDVKSGTSALVITMNVASSESVLTLETDESYKVTINPRACSCKAPTPCQHEVDDSCFRQSQSHTGRMFCNAGTIDCSVQPSILEANITAPTFYGARHGLETVAQLIAFDEAHNEV
jgi:hypothetical protein